MMRNNRGFTLIEILTVVAIITIVGGFSLAAIGQARVRARDDQRIRDIKTIQSALELYRVDLDRSTDSADIGKYAYPVRIDPNDSQQLGIYGDPRFAKYLTKTPVDPLRKSNYVYFAPACLHPSKNATDPVIVTPAGDSSYHTVAQIQASTTLCPNGSGWLPYVVFGLLERPIAGKSKSSTFANLAGLSTTAVAHSILQPVFNTTTGSSYVANKSYCYPAIGTGCPDPFPASTKGTSGPTSNFLKFP